ncbi:MAG: metalloregulator ArsR/SmtB family transcription factor [Caldilineaceae bacterium]
MMNTFDALADSTRRQIVELLAHREHAAGEIAEHFPISAPAISQHLKVLREANLVTVRVDAQRRMYALNPAGLAEVDAWLAQVRGFWSGRLDALAAQLEAEDAAENTRENVDG